MNLFKINPIKFFAFLLILAFSLGITVKSLLRSDALNNFIKKQLLVSQSKHSELTYSDFSIFVSKKYLLPTLVLEVNQLKFLTIDNCNSELEVLADTAIAPVNLFRALFLRENINFDLEVNHLVINNKKISCGDEDIKTNKSLSKSATAQVYLNQLIDKYPRLIKLSNKISVRVRSARVKKVDLNNINYFKSEVLSQFVFKNMNLDFKGRSSLLSLSSSISWKSLYSHGEEINIPQFKLSLNKDSLKTNLLGRFNEGDLNAQVKINIEKKMINSQFKIKQLPLKEFNIFLKRLGFNYFDLSSSLSWLTCNAKIVSSTENLFYKLHSLERCQIVGELGEWKLSDYKFKLTSLHMQPNTAFVSVKKARLKKIIDNFTSIKKVDYISRFGLFSGELKLDPKNMNWHIMGQLKNTRLQLTLLKKQYEQLIKSIDIKIIGSGKNYKLIARKFELNQGDVKGELTYKYVNNDRAGSLDAQFDKVEFSKKIQNKAFFGETIFNNVISKGSYDNGLLDLKTNLSSETYESTYFKTGPYKLLLDIKNSKVSGQAILSDLTLKKDLFKNKMVSLKTIFNENSIAPDYFKGSRLNYYYDNNDYVWSFSGGKEGGNSYNLFGFTRDDDFFSQLKFEFTDKNITWQWSGSPSKKIQLSLNNIDTGIKSESGIGAFENHLIKKAELEVVDSSQSKYLKFIEKAKSLLPFSK